MAHAYNPSYVGSGDWYDGCLRPSWGKNLQDRTTTNNLDSDGTHINPKLCRRNRKEDHSPRPVPGKNKLSNKRAGGMAQGVQHLPSDDGALI
jgi:hypothetical protein